MEPDLIGRKDGDKMDFVSLALLQASTHSISVEAGVGAATGRETVVLFARDLVLFREESEAVSVEEVVLLSWSQGGY